LYAHISKNLSAGNLVMNIGGSEWIIIIILAMILLFGTKKLPQVSRTIGRAMTEYEKAKETFRTEIQGATSLPSGLEEFRGPKIMRPVNSEREKLEAIAASLGIEHNNAISVEQLRALITERMKT
jgi:sec-independent protein translocase protein TatA